MCKDAVLSLVEFNMQNTAVSNEEEGHNIIVFVASEFTHGLCLSAGGLKDPSGSSVTKQRDCSSGPRCEMSQDCGASLTH